MSFIVTKLKTVHNGVKTYQPKSFDWITSTKSSKWSCEDDQEYLIDQENLSFTVEGIYLDYDNKKNEPILESQIFTCLHSAGFCIPTPKHPYTNVWSP